MDRIVTVFKRSGIHTHDVGQFHYPHSCSLTKLIQIERQKLYFVMRDRYRALGG